ncbi:MAG TPA: hypothetical protein PKC87_00430 [Candidatus Absconditabacterales bacterium]|nr:hypothetical protein [Candidatus Absconditabacterales bacterium]
MIKNFFHAIFFTTLGLMSVFSTFAIVVEVPSSQGQEDVIVTGPTQIQGDEGTFFETIQTINTYLRFSLGSICMGVLIFGGIKLITAQGDAAKMKEANKLLMGALIGILIAIFSYAIVRIIVNLL